MFARILERIESLGGGRNNRVAKYNSSIPTRLMVRSTSSHKDSTTVVHSYGHVLVLACYHFCIAPWSNILRRPLPTSEAARPTDSCCRSHDVVHKRAFEQPQHAGNHSSRWLGICLLEGKAASLSRRRFGLGFSPSMKVLKDED